MARKSTGKLSKRPAKRKRHKPASRVSSGPAFAKLVAVMARLRAPGGCPWDREQTHATLRTYLIEEAYEVLDALDSTDDVKFAEELGDLLLQVLFHAQIASEEGRFAIDDVIREIYEKMIRRHPHVFGEERAKDAAEVLRNWEIIKQEERRNKKTAGAASLGSKGAGFDVASSGDSASSDASDPPVSILDGVPRTLPALLEGLQLTRKAARIGFDWHHVDGIFDKFAEEATELRHALDKKESPSRIESEVGDILFVAVNLARFLNVDPEIAMKKASSKFSRRFHEMERLARQQGTTLAEIPRPQMESLWEQSKLQDHLEHP
jgi:tetrapyrrole methylase family protein / MazG family protein